MEYIGFALVCFVMYMAVRSLVFGVKDKMHDFKAFNEMKENKCPGPHKWHSIADTVYGDISDFVCLDCGFLRGEIELFLDKVAIDNIKLLKRSLEKLAAYKEKDKQRLADTHNLSMHVIDDIYESGVSIKKNFTLEEIESKARFMLKEELDG